MPYTEPNSLPQPYVDWQEWRKSYTFVVQDFQTGHKGLSDTLQLCIRLKRLGYISTNLEAEMTYIKEN